MKYGHLYIIIAIALIVLLARLGCVSEFESSKSDMSVKQTVLKGEITSSKSFNTIGKGALICVFTKEYGYGRLELFGMKEYPPKMFEIGNIINVVLESENYIRYSVFDGNYKKQDRKKGSELGDVVIETD